MGVTIIKAKQLLNNRHNYLFIYEFSLSFNQTVPSDLTKLFMKKIRTSLYLLSNLPLVGNRKSNQRLSTGIRQSFDKNGDGPATYDIKNYIVSILKTWPWRFTILYEF